MSVPQRIRLSRARGWKLRTDAINVARPGRWGNLFIVGKHGTRAQCAAMFLQLARGFIDLASDIEVDAQLTMYRRIRRHIHNLKGRDLACWCPLDGAACHGDVLLLLANPDLETPQWLQKPGVALPRLRLGMASWDIDKLAREQRQREREALA